MSVALPGPNPRRVHSWALANPKTGEWASALTFGISATVGGSELFYPGKPIWTSDPSLAITRRTEEAAREMLAGAAYLGVLVPLYEVTP